MKSLSSVILPYFQDRVILAALTLSLVLIQVGVWVLWFKLPDLPSQAPLWYTAAPIYQLVDVGYLWIIPGFATGSLLVNLGLGIWLHRKYEVVSRMLLVASAGISLLAAVAVIRTVQIFTTLF